MKDSHSPAYARYVLFILTLSYTCSYLDRYILSVLVEPIKAELQISDTQMGFLGGLAFALLYTLAGIPIARLADRHSRRSIIAIGIGFWSLMTVACGLARNFTHLALARLGVGLGEAACTPPSHSLIADYFPPQKRATALSIYGMAIPLGMMLGFLVGGWVTHFFGWRTAFLVVGAPGLLLALVVRFTVVEPERGRLEAQQGKPKPYSFMQAIRFLLGNRALVLIQLAGGFFSLAAQGIGFWIAPFFSRVHGLPIQQLGTWLALGAFIGGITGSYLAGRSADFFGRRGTGWYLLTPAVVFTLTLPAIVAMVTVGNTTLALMLYVIFQIGVCSYGGPVYAAMQFIVPANMRALIVAIHLFILNIVGMGLGPFIMGGLNDALLSAFGPAGAIRMSMLIILSTMLIAIVILVLAAKTLMKDDKLAVSGETA